MKTHGQHCRLEFDIQTEPMEDADDAWQVEREYFEEGLLAAGGCLQALCLASKTVQENVIIV